MSGSTSPQDDTRACGVRSKLGPRHPLTVATGPTKLLRVRVSRWLWLAAIRGSSRLELAVQVLQPLLSQELIDLQARARARAGGREAAGPSPGGLQLGKPHRKLYIRQGPKPRLPTLNSPTLHRTASLSPQRLILRKAEPPRNQRKSSATLSVEAARLLPFFGTPPTPFALRLLSPGAGDSNHPQQEPLAPLPGWWRTVVVEHQRPLLSLSGLLRSSVSERADRGTNGGPTRSVCKNKGLLESQDRLIGSVPKTTEAKPGMRLKRRGSPPSYLRSPLRRHSRALQAVTAKSSAWGEAAKPLMCVCVWLSWGVKSCLSEVACCAASGACIGAQVVGASGWCPEDSKESGISKLAESKGYDLAKVWWV